MASFCAHHHLAHYDAVCPMCASNSIGAGGVFVTLNGPVQVPDPPPHGDALAIAERMEWGHTDPADPPEPWWDSCYFCDRGRGNAEHAAGCPMAALLGVLRARAPDPLAEAVIAAAVAYSNPASDWKKQVAQRKTLDAAVAALVAAREGNLS